MINPKALIPQNIASVNPLEWQWKDGECVGLMVTCEVNYGERGVQHQVDIWPDLTKKEQKDALAIYRLIVEKVTETFLPKIEEDT